jgi:hypothetical protein
LRRARGSGTLDRVSTLIPHGQPLHLDVPDSLVSTPVNGVRRVTIPDPSVVGGNSLEIGDGTGSPALTLDKLGTGTDSINMRNVGDLRGRLRLDASENVVISVHDADEVELGSITLNNSTGAITCSKGLTITTGGLTVSAGNVAVSAGSVTAQAGLVATTGGVTATAGGVTITAGGLSLVAGNAVLTSGVRLQANLPSAADDAAAALLNPVVPIGGLYHTAGAVKQRLA